MNTWVILYRKIGHTAAYCHRYVYVLLLSTFVLPLTKIKYFHRIEILKNTAICYLNVTFLSHAALLNNNLNQKRRE